MERQQLQLFRNLLLLQQLRHSLNTWLKTGATLNDFNPHNETYDYGQATGDVNGPYNDYLVQAINAGGSGQTENWTHDPAGNRHDTGSGFAN